MIKELGIMYVDYMGRGGRGEKGEVFSSEDEDSCNSCDERLEVGSLMVCDNRGSWLCLECFLNDNDDYFSEAQEDELRLKNYNNLVEHYQEKLQELRENNSKIINKIIANLEKKKMEIDLEIKKLKS